MDKVTGNCHLDVDSQIWTYDKNLPPYEKKYKVQTSAAGEFSYIWKLDDTQRVKIYLVSPVKKDINWST